MREKTHAEQIARWAEYVREHPEEWKKKLKPFLDSQFIIARRFYKKLAETPDGMKALRQIKLIKTRIN